MSTKLSTMLCSLSKMKDGEMTDKVTKSVYNKTTAVSDDTKYRQEKNS